MCMQRLTEMWVGSNFESLPLERRPSIARCHRHAHRDWSPSPEHLHELGDDAHVLWVVGGDLDRLEPGVE